MVHRHLVSPLDGVAGRDCDIAGLNAMLFMVTLWLSAIFSSLAGTCYIGLAAAIRKPTLTIHRQGKPTRRYCRRQRIR